MLEFYWSIGRDLVALRAEERWGAGVVKQFALDMRQAYPDAKGFSDTNIKYMKRWYLFYYERLIKSQRAVDLFETEKSHQLGDQLAENEKSQQAADQLTKEEKGHQLVDQIDMPQTFGMVPWGQHIDIISRCSSIEEALFYIRKTTGNGWSRPMLNN